MKRKKTVFSNSLKLEKQNTERYLIIIRMQNNHKERLRDFLRDCSQQRLELAPKIRFF